MIEKASSGGGMNKGKDLLDKILFLVHQYPKKLLDT